MASNVTAHPQSLLPVILHRGKFTPKIQSQKGNLEASIQSNLVFQMQTLANSPDFLFNEFILQ